MAANTGKSELKRDSVKYLRDKAKAHYKKASNCEICGSSEELELHHYKSLSILWDNWLKEQAIVIENVDDVIYHRDRFIAEYSEELYITTVTLCATHHKKLHSIYGAMPALHTASKQMNWCKIQREKELAKKA